MIRDERTHVVRVVQKGTRLKSPGPSLLASAPETIGVVVLVLWFPVRALMLLIFRNSFKVALVEVGAYPEEERILERHTARGEKEALALAQRLVAQHEETGERSG
ncbi:MAG: hypothetical protein M3P83_08365 [Actinomycetota bacterium]|nr:hypothetical protein [Actinomycetota bacterium]